MIILGVESTCDETSVAFVENGKKVLSNVIASSSLMHEKYGGIVPEVAAREQVRVMVPTLIEALKESGVEIQDIDAIAVAYGPGLVGSLLVGVETAKTLAFAWNKKIIGVNHLVGHLYANWIEEETRGQKPETSNIELPAVGLIVSGGHTDLVYMETHKKIKLIGGTLDDAAGEVLDKTARVLGLGYPGGPAIEKAAEVYGAKIANNQLPLANSLPLPMAGNKSFDFSFSGIKTAVVNKIHFGNDEPDVFRICYELQERIFQSLIKKTFAATTKYEAKSVIIGGGVSANSRLRELMNKSGKENSVKIFFPEKKYSTDNGAMVATAAYYNQDYMEVSKLQADPSLYFV